MGMKAANGRAGGGNITPVAFRGGKERRRQGSRGRFNPFRAIGEFIDEFRKPKESEPVPEAKRPERETNVESQIKPFGTVESDLPRPGYGKEVSIPGLPNDITGTDVTKPRAREPNYETDLTRPEFESILSKLGWAKEPSPDGEAMNYWKDGARYSVRDYAKSTESPTAEFFHPFGNTNRDRADMKLRLRKE
jgi:hypothetical protein